MLEFVKITTGVGIITNKRVYSSRHLPSYTYSVYNRQAFAVLEQVQAHLKSYKALRTKLILGRYIELTPRNGRYTKSQLVARRRFEEKVLNIKRTRTY